MAIQDIIQAKPLPTVDEMLVMYKADTAPSSDIEEVLQTQREMLLSAAYMAGHTKCISELQFQSHDKPTLVQFIENHERDITKFNKQLTDTHVDELTDLSRDNLEQNKAGKQAEADFFHDLSVIVSRSLYSKPFANVIADFVAERQSFENEYDERNYFDGPGAAAFFVS